MILIVDFGSSKTADIVNVVSEFVECVAKPWRSVTVNDIAEYEGIVLSGAPILITELEMSGYLESFHFLRFYEKPVLGICFGHQLLGLLHGATAYKMPEDRHWRSIELLTPSSISFGLQTPFTMRQDHCERISLPKGFTHLMRSEVCDNEGMKHSSLPHFSVQFHPEVSAENGRLLIRNFCNICVEHATPFL